MRRAIPLLSLLPLVVPFVAGCGGDCPPGSTLSEADGLCYLEGGDSGTGDGEGDTDVPPPEPGAAPAVDISSEVSELVRTVVTVRWSTESSSTGYVEFGETDSYGHQTPLTDAGTAHEAMLLGLWADTTFHFRVVTTSEDGVDHASADYTVTTGSLPVEVPTMTTIGEATWEGFIFAPFQGINYLAAAFDTQGRVVWYKVIDSDTHHIMRAEPMFNGEGVAICMAGQDSQGNKEDGYVLQVAMDGSTIAEIDAPYIDHDMVLLPDNTAAGIVLLEDEQYSGYGDSIQEVSQSGEMVEIFNAWDHVDELADALPGQSGEWKGEQNWSHANALDFYPDSDTYYMAMKNLHTTVKVDRSTGALQWALGGQGNQFVWADGTDPLGMHHQFHIFEEGRFLVFENGDPGRGYSMVREFVLDEENLVAEEVWSYIRDPGVYVYAKGDVERLSNGNTLVTWSSSGEIQEVQPDGTVQWQVNTELGAAITFVNRVDSLYAR